MRESIASNERALTDATNMRSTLERHQATVLDKFQRLETQVRARRGSVEGSCDRRAGRRKEAATVAPAIARSRNSRWRRPSRPWTRRSRTRRWSRPTTPPPPLAPPRTRPWCASPPLSRAPPPSACYSALALADARGRISIALGEADAERAAACVVGCARPQIRSIRERIQETSNAHEAAVRGVLDKYAALQAAVLDYNSRLEHALTA